MIIDRRAFVAGTTLVAVMPTVPSLPRDVSSPAPDAARPFLMIHGWSMNADVSADDRVWLTVGHGWRTAWR